jgi:hypothetical protein
MNLEAIREAREELLAAAAALEKVLALANSERVTAPAPRLLAPEPPPPPARAARKPTSRDRINGWSEPALLLRKVVEALPKPFTIADIKTAFEKQHAGVAKRLSETFVVGYIMRWQDRGELERVGKERPAHYQRTKRWDASDARISRKETAYRELRESMKLPQTAGTEEEK